MENKDLRQTYYGYLRYFLGKDEKTATSSDKYMALAYAVRSELVDNWIKTQKQYAIHNVRRVYYLSMEYVFGKSLNHNIVNLGIEEPIGKAVLALGFSLPELFSQEDDFELGNSGKGRASACFLDSMATLGIPAMAYGLRYDYAQFQQDITHGIQVERPYDWLHRGHPWEIIRPEYSCAVQFAGKCSQLNADTALSPYSWESTEQVHAIPYDVPIPGYHNNVVNTLRLWSARASEEFLPDYANHGDYVRACEEKSELGRITKVLFPDEDIRRASELRMKQQYFFISSTIQDIIRRYKVQNDNLLEFDKKVVIQLDGSRCALAIPELMRILVDVEKISWDKAWTITNNVFAYTSHAVLKDHLECWPVYKVSQIFPRHMQIMFDINQIHLEKIRTTFSSDPEIVRELSLIEEGEVKRIRLANLAALGSFSVNGISRVQTDILCKKLFPVHTKFFPNKFNNKTTGIAHRRWLLCGNPDLAELISEVIGTGWTLRLEELAGLSVMGSDAAFIAKLQQVRQQSKQRLIRDIGGAFPYAIDECALFDIQIGKVHPFKRQVLHLFYILHTYLQIKAGETVKVPRVHFFAGKASPSDFLAKQIIHLINVVADLVNGDPVVREQIKVVFIANFNTSQAERIVPAADLSEQLSTALFEASGTFNMKFALNGAMTIASRSGSNIEMVEQIGDSAVLMFGKTAQELEQMQAYKPFEFAASDSRLSAIFALLDSLLPTLSDGTTIYPLISSLRDTDRFFVLIDFDDYIRQQERITTAYENQPAWFEKSLTAIAKSGWFASDRTIKEYAGEIWKIPVL